MTRRRRTHILHPQTGTVYRGWLAGQADSTATAAVGPNYDTTWVDKYDLSVWSVDFSVAPYTVTQTTGNAIDGWVLNDGYFLYLYRQSQYDPADRNTIVISNNPSLLTPRFRSVPTSLNATLYADTSTGTLVHTVP